MKKLISKQNIEIFVFGRTRSGKTTFCDNLFEFIKKNNLNDIEPSNFCSIFSDTKIPSRKSIYHESNIISIQDTRGLFEVRIDEEELSNKDILVQIVLKFFSKENRLEKDCVFHSFP